MVLRLFKNLLNRLLEGLVLQPEILYNGVQLRAQMFLIFVKACYGCSLLKQNRKIEEV